LLCLYTIEYAVLQPQPGRTVSLPLAPKGFIVEPFDQPKPLGAGHVDNVFPFFVPLQNLLREAFELPTDTAMLVDFPHHTKIL
jgi:hypothetical protein